MTSKILCVAAVLAMTLPAAAADLPLRAVKAPVLVTTASPFYVFIHGGGGFTDVQNDIALPGVATGSPKLWPAGFMAGGGLGWLSSVGILSFGVEAEGNYDFTRASVGCVPGFPCAGSTKNSWFFAEKVLAGITLSQLTGHIPGAASPANWPIPITVPASFASNMMLLGVVGAAQRNVDLCAMDIVSLNTFCGSQWKNGLLVGGQGRFAISQNVSARIEYDYITFKQTFTAASAAPLFANTIAAKNEQRFMAGFNINLQPLF